MILSTARILFVLTVAQILDIFIGIRSVFLWEDSFLRGSYYSREYFTLSLGPKEFTTLQLSIFYPCAALLVSPEYPVNWDEYVSIHSGKFKYFAFLFKE